MSHIFISYSRKDIDFAQKIVDALAANGLDTWIDRKSIPSGEEWEREIYRGIEEADAFLFLISLDSVKSAMCNKEIAHAVKNGKRILPIFISSNEVEEVNRSFFTENAREEISKRNYLFCREGVDDFSQAIEKICNTLHTDYEWLKYHTKLQVRALDWERENRRNDILLRGVELEQAQERLRKATHELEPPLTALQESFIKASDLAQRTLKKRIRQGILFGLLAILILPYLWLASHYYLDRSDTGGGIVVRAGDPRLKILPGFGFVIVGTDYSLSDIAAPYESQVTTEKVQGFWLSPLNWGEKLYPLLIPSQSGLAYWRAGQHEQAIAILAKAVRNNDQDAVKILAYLIFLNPSEESQLIDALLPALDGDNDTRQAALQALGYFRSVNPDAASLQAETLIQESRTSGISQVQAIEAAGTLGVDSKKALGGLLEILAVQQADTIEPAASASAALISRGESLQPDLIDEIINQAQTLPAGPQTTILKPLLGLDLSAEQKYKLEQILVEKLSSPISSEQIFGMQSLSDLNLEDPQLLLQSINRLQDDPDQTVRASLPNLLLKVSQHEPARSFDLLANIALSDTSEQVRYDAVQAIRGWYAYDQNKVFNTLVQASGDSSDLVRISSLEALTNLQLETSCCLDGVENTLASKLDDESFQVRLMVAQGLLLLSDQIQNPAALSQAAQIFSLALADPNPSTSTVAQQLAGRYTDSEAIIATAKLLLPYLQNADGFRIDSYTSFFEQALERQPAAIPSISILFSSLSQKGNVEYFIWQINQSNPAMRAQTMAIVVNQLLVGDKSTKQNTLQVLSTLGAHLDKSVAEQALQAISPYQKDDDPALRAEAFEATGVIGMYYPDLVAGYLPEVLDCLRNNSGALQLSCSQAVLDYAQAEDNKVGFSAGDLYLIMEGPTLPSDVRLSIAKTLVAISGSGNLLSETEMVDLKEQIRTEKDAFIRYWLAGVLASYSDPASGQVDFALSTLRQAAVNGGTADREEIIKVLRVLGEKHQSLSEKVIQEIGAFVTDPDNLVRIFAITSIRDVGLINIQNAGIGMDSFLPALTSHQDGIRLDAVANGVAPLLRAYPQLAGKSIELLDRSSRVEITNPGIGFSLLSEIRDDQILAYKTVGDENPDLLWPMITSPDANKRYVGRAVIVQILKSKPDKMLLFQADLAGLQRACQPQACLSISLTQEMMALLQNPRFMALLQTENADTQLINWLPSAIGLEPLGNK